MSDQKQIYFEFLRDLPLEFLVEFCKLSFEYLFDDGGGIERKLTIAAGKLDKTSDFIRSTIEALVHFLVDNIRLNTSRAELDYLTGTGFTAEQIDILWQFITSKEASLRPLLYAPNELHFRGLDWRLEARIASRSLLQQATPQIALKVHLDRERITECKLPLSGGDLSSAPTQRQVLMHVDPGSLSQIIQSLEEAILESKTHRTRIFCRAFQG